MTTAITGVTMAAATMTATMTATVMARTVSPTGSGKTSHTVSPWFSTPATTTAVTLTAVALTAVTKALMDAIASPAAPQTPSVPVKTMTAAGVAAHPAAMEGASATFAMK